MPTVRRACAEEAPAIATVLARAFVADPVAAYLFPGVARREECLRRFFALQLHRNYLARGEVWVEECLQGAALWMPPEPRPATLMEVLGHLPLAAVLWGRFGAARELARTLAARHPRSRHYYLGTIGTEPSVQRHGIGSALLDVVLSSCDASGTPAYLESSRRENVAFYEARGFSVVDEVTAAPAGPRLWLMWRQPSIVAGG